MLTREVPTAHMTGLTAQQVAERLRSEGYNELPSRGRRGTDVAREAAALVLLDDDFSSIVRAVRMGRRIFDNLRKAMSYILAIHVPIAGMALLPVLFGWPLVLMPVQIVFLELIIDPASSIVFEAEPEESDVMRRPPRDPRTPLFTRATALLSLLLGFSIFAVVLVVFRVSLAVGISEGESRALTFTALVIANLALVLATRSRTRTILATLRTPNRALWWVLGGGALLLALVLSVPFLRDLFGFAAIPPLGLLVCLGAGFVSMLWFEGVKVVYTRWRRWQVRHDEGVAAGNAGRRTP